MLLVLLVCTIKKNNINFTVITSGLELQFYCDIYIYTAVLYLVH